MLKFSVLLFLLLSVPAAAQSPSRILKKAENALGGTKALQSRTSVRLLGRISRVSDGASGRFALESSRPNSLHVIYDILGDEIEIGYNGRSAWRRTKSTGLKTLTGSESLIMQAISTYKNWLWLNAKANRSRLIYGGRSVVGSRDSELVIFTTPKGIASKLYFASETGLPLKEEFGNESWEYDDYRSIKGVKIPFVMRAMIDGQMYEIKLDDAVLNNPVAAAVFDFPKADNEPFPDLNKLLAELRANQDRIENMLDSYSYTRKSISREVAKDGTMREIESETDQMSFYKGYRIERKIEKNGNPLTPSEQADEDKAVAKRAEDIEKRIAKADKNGANENDQRTVSIAELLRASNLINPRRERFREREMIVFDFEPNPKFDYKNAKSMLKFFGKTAGVIWVDEKDKQTVRVEAFLADDFSIGGGLLVKLKKGATFVAEQERINDEIWLPSVMEINLNAKVLMLKGVNVNQVVKAYDYRKFQTEVKDAKVNEVQKP